MAMQKYLDHRSELPDVGNELGFWATLEDVVNQYKEPAATQAVFLINEFVPNMEPNIQDDQQRRSGSASKRDPILLRINHGTATAEFYARTNGPNSVPGTNDASLPQGHDLYAASFGDFNRSKNLIDSITAVISHARSASVVTVADGTKYEVGDICTLRCADTTRLGHMETRRISAIATNDLTFSPGFSSLPTTDDDLQNGLTYKLVQDISDKTLTCITKYGKAVKVSTGTAAQKFMPKVDGVGVHSHQVELGLRNATALGLDYVKDDGSGVGSFTNSDLTLKVHDWRLFPVGSLWKLVVYTVATAAAATEGATTPLVVSSVNTATGVVTFANRGNNPQATTALYAVSTASEVAETYDLSTRKYLDINIDNRGWITIDVTAPTAPAVPAAATAAEVVANINVALSKSPLYGQEVNSASPLGISWATAASVSSAKVKITSQVPGSQSRIQVRASATLDAGVTTVGSRLFSAAFDAKATDEAQLVPWTPLATEASAEPQGSFPGWCIIDGIRTMLQEISPSLDNKLLWHEDEKADTAYPTGFGRPGTRDVTLTIKGKVYGKTSHFEYLANNLTSVNLHIQVGKTEGSIHSYSLPAVTVVRYVPSAPQDGEMTYELTVRVGATSALENEMTYGIN